MKQIFLTFFLFLVFTNTKAQDKELEKLVQQLQALKAAVLAEDKQTVAQFFQFPVKDKNFKTKMEWNGKEAESIKKADRGHFLKFYDRLFTPEVMEMFRQLDFAKLHEQAEIRVEVLPKSKTDYCTHTNEAVFLDNQVVLSFLSNSRHDIQLSDENYCEEYAEMWQFDWKNGQLRFHSLQMAG